MDEQRRIARLYNKVFSTPPNSPERTRALAALSDEDNEKITTYHIALVNGNTQEISFPEQEMSYQEYVRLKRDRAAWNQVKVGEFERKHPDTAMEYQQRSIRDAKRRREIMSIENEDERLMAIARNKSLFS